MKYLVIGGCSHAVGTGLPEALGHRLEGGVRPYKIYRYSALLAKKLNLEEINLGKDGASNWQIYINVMSWILNNQEKLNETLFVISWTYADRNYLALEGDFYGAHDKLIYSCRANNTVTFIPKDLTKFNNENFHSRDELWDGGIIKNSLLYMTGLTSFLSNQNLKYLHFHSDFFLHKGPDGKVNIHEPKKLSEYIAKYIDLFDTKNYIIDETYRWYCKFDRLMPPKYDFYDGHIGPDGQKLWADYLYQQLIDREIYNE
jgi:hypothetical protein